MSEELAAELAAMRKLVALLTDKIEQLQDRLAPHLRCRSIMKEDGTAAELYPPKRIAQWRGRDDEDDGSD